MIKWSFVEFCRLLAICADKHSDSSVFTLLSESSLLLFSILTFQPGLLHTLLKRVNVGLVPEREGLSLFTGSFLIMCINFWS